MSNFQQQERDIIEIRQYDDSSTSFEERTIPTSAVSDWIKSDLTEPKNGKTVKAFAKILVLAHLSDPGILDFIEKVSRDAGIDAGLASDVWRYNYAALMVESFATMSTIPRLCFYSPATTLAFTCGAWSFDTVTRGTRAIIVNRRKGLSIGLAETLASNVDSLGHPLFLSVSFRTMLLAQCQASELDSQQTLNLIEADVGYSGLIYSGVEPEDIDLADCSKQVGKGMSTTIIQQAMISMQVSAREYLGSDQSYRWVDCFPEHEKASYRELCKIVLRKDEGIEQRLQGLRTMLAMHQSRASTLLTVLFNLIARQDVNASIELAKDSRTIALATKNDSSSMKTIAVMTMLFLPATFFAALFSTPMLDWHGPQIIQPRFWIYWAFTIPCTVLVLISWYFITKRRKALQAKEDLEEREKVMKRANTILSTAETGDLVKPTLKQNGQALTRRLPRWRQDEISTTPALLRIE